MEKILFICTGNTCRSPMAEAIAKELIKNNGLQISVSSAGFRHSGKPISPAANKALQENGLTPLPEHRSRQLPQTRQAVADAIAADVIYCMEQSHVEQLNELMPELQEKVFLFSSLVGRDDDVMNPYGQDQKTYNDVCKKIADTLHKALTT